ncbi:MAG: hypothetical protein J5598_01205, partial [Clostridia bacterium]|nr:hypothetical protein [Clostridia bacterium]
MNNQQPKKKKFNWWWLVIGLIVIFLLINLTTPTTKLDTISQDEFESAAGVKLVDGNYQQVYESKIYGVYKVGTTYYVLYNETYNSLDLAKRTQIDNDKNYIKTYATATVYDSTNHIRAMIAATNITFEESAVPSSWTEWVIPVIYILMFLGVLFFLWRGMAGRNGLANMTQNRATVVFNGPTRFS